MVAQVAEPQSSAPQQLGLSSVGSDPNSENPLDGAKTLICALNFLSRNLPLPQHVYDAVSSICLEAPAESGHEDPADVGNDVEGDVRNGAASPLPTVSDFLLPCFSLILWCRTIRDTWAFGILFFYFLVQFLGIYRISGILVAERSQFYVY